LAFLFGVTTWTPAPSQSPYLPATNSEDVLSTTTAAPPVFAALVFNLATRASRSAAVGASALSAATSQSGDRAIADGGVYRLMCHAVGPRGEDHVLGVGARGDA
jgi:hypothetical protein